MPNLSVGHLTLTDQNFKSFIKSNKMFVLGVSDSSCLNCCYTELSLSNLKEKLDANIMTNEKVRICFTFAIDTNSAC